MGEVKGICDCTCGWIAGVCGLIVGHPADTIKVRQQTLGGMNVLRCAVATFKYEGVLGFYKGLSFPVITAGVMNSLFFGVYGTSLRLLSKNESEKLPSLTSVFLAGGMAGVAQLGVSTSVDLIKIKLQAQTGTTKTWGQHYEAGYKGPVDCILRIIKAEGITGMFRGIVPTFWRDVPAFAVYMGSYEYMVRALLKDKARETSTIPLLIAGGLAGSISWGIIVPLDVIKSRMQADRAANPQYKGMIDCFRQSIIKDGPKVFFRGFFLIVLRAFPVNAAILLSYERCLTTCNYLHLK